MNHVGWVHQNEIKCTNRGHDLDTTEKVFKVNLSCTGINICCQRVMNCEYNNNAPMSKHF